jgi:hypothetical protein
MSSDRISSDRIKSIKKIKTWEILKMQIRRHKKENNITKAYFH